MSIPLQIRLDSSRPTAGNWTGSWSSARRILRCDRPDQTALHESGRIVKTWRDPLDALRWMTGSLANTADSSTARWVGYLSYDLGRLLENISVPTRKKPSTPLFVFAEVAGSTEASNSPSDARRNATHVSSTFSKERYCQAVERVIAYIRAGDVFQVNLSQQFSYATDAPASAIYQRLLNDAPSAYGALLDFSDHAIISNSPELFLHVTPDRRLITRPIKGTRPRQPGADIELRDSLKDQAELNMIVDLERNDLGRVCEIGSVRVTEPRTIEAHPTVYHGVATIEGKLRDNVDFVELLRATFPGGSVTGAPKIRAMQIIDELEPTQRDVYCGAIGYLTGDGTIEFNIAIRTMLLRDRIATLAVGGGVVADSIPLSEYEETLVKARALQRSLGVSEPSDSLK